MRRLGPYKKCIAYMCGAVRCVPYTVSTASFTSLMPPSSSSVMNLVCNKYITICKRAGNDIVSSWNCHNTLLTRIIQYLIIIIV